MTNKLTKVLLVSSAVIGFQAVQAQAADIVVAEPEPVEYVRVCDAYGAGYFYIPGTETCMKVGGYVRAQAQLGDKIGHGSFTTRDSYDTLARATLQFSTATQTDLGQLNTFVELRSEFANGDDAEVASGALRFAYIELGGLRVGVDESAFKVFAGDYGNVLNDDTFPAASTERTNKIQYTYAADNGFSATIALEEGDKANQITDYVPHVVVGAKIQQGWGSAVVVAGYDSVKEEYAVKARADVNINDALSAWVMAGYKTGHNKQDIKSVDYFGQWYGDFAAWGGLSYQMTAATTANLQLSYESVGNLYVAANVGIKLAPGLTLTPELNFASYDNSMNLDDNTAFGGIVRLQRNF